VLTQEPSPEAVASLEQALARVRAGEARAVMVATMLTDGTFTVGWGGTAPVLERIGLLEAVKHEMLADAERYE
jgi:hypothetical protein